MPGSTNGNTNVATAIYKCLVIVINYICIDMNCTD